MPIETKLLPCPFCGGEAELDEYCGKYVVFCKNNSCSWRDTEAEAIEAWNTRHERTSEFTFEDKGDGWWWYCSNCGKLPPDYDLDSVPNYCPNCGARVKEDQ